MSSQIGGINDQRYVVTYYQLFAGSVSPASAVVRLRKGGQELQANATGVDCLDSLCKAADNIIGTRIPMENRRISQNGGEKIPGMSMGFTTKAVILHEDQEYEGIGLGFNRDQVNLQAYVNAHNTRIEKTGK